MSDQAVTRPLPKHRATQTQNKHTHTPNIRALRGIETHVPSVQASEYSSYLRPCGYCDRLLPLMTQVKAEQLVHSWDSCP
jgi:hypothetical protein